MPACDGRVTTGLAFNEDRVVMSPHAEGDQIEIEPRLCARVTIESAIRYAKQARVPDFARAMSRERVRTRFKAEIPSDVLRELFPESINEAIEKHELTPLVNQTLLDNTEALEKFGESLFR